MKELIISSSDCVLRVIKFLKDNVEEKIIKKKKKRKKETKNIFPKDMKRETSSLNRGFQISESDGERVAFSGFCHICLWRSHKSHVH